MYNWALLLYDQNLKKNQIGSHIRNCFSDQYNNNIFHVYILFK